MKKNSLESKEKKKYVKPEIKSYTIEELSKTWNFEVFGVCPACMSVGTCCAAD